MTDLDRKIKIDELKNVLNILASGRTYYMGLPREDWKIVAFNTGMFSIFLEGDCQRCRIAEFVVDRNTYEQLKAADVPITGEDKYTYTPFISIIVNFSKIMYPNFDIFIPWKI